MDIEWNEVVEPAMSSRERKIESLTVTFVKSLLVGTLFLLVGIGAVIFMAYHLNHSNLELDGGIGKIFSVTTILSAVGVVISGSRALNARAKKKLL